MLRDYLGKKNGQKLDFHRLGEGVRLDEGKIHLGEGGLRLGEPKVNFHAVFYFTKVNQSCPATSCWGTFVAW